MRPLNTLITIVTIALTICSCSNEEPIITTPQEVTERVDIKIDDEEMYYYFEQSKEADQAVNLVELIGTTSPNRLTYVIRLSDQKTLKIDLVNKIVHQPWQVENSYYGIYPTEELNNKTKYITAQLVDNSNSETTTFSSNPLEGSPRGATIDAFRIEKYDEQKSETLCRINDLQLVMVGNPNKTITINGTYRGALVFN